jgi:hypothetical protein
MPTSTRSRLWLRVLAFAALMLLVPHGHPAAAAPVEAAPEHATVVAAGLASEVAAVTQPPTQPAGPTRGPHAVQSPLVDLESAPFLGWARPDAPAAGAAAVAAGTVQERAPPVVAG